VAGEDPHGHPRGRHRPHPDRHGRGQRRHRGAAARLRRAHGRARRREHLAQHRRPPHGRRPARRPRALRLRARGVLVLGPHLVRRASFFQEAR
jgi:hypothetical protein